MKGVGYFNWQVPEELIFLFRKFEKILFFRRILYLFKFEN